MNGENEPFLKEQIITYLGNKRALLGAINEAILAAKNDLKKDKISFLDLFSGSGVVARLAKSHADFIIANDLESYSAVINRCYLANITSEMQNEIKRVFDRLKNIKDFKSGMISELYAPKKDDDIKPGERAFYTRFNALFLDTMRGEIEKINSDLRPFFLAPLLYLASTHTNTGGVFKGFYKDKNGVGKFGGEAANALNRITAKMQLLYPVFSSFSVPFEVLKDDANKVATEVKNIDIAYLDPPYNQHPYGSNYFMLNLLCDYKMPSKISPVSGIAAGWNRSVFNQKSAAAEAFFSLCDNLKAKYLIISFNNEGNISEEQFGQNLAKIGRVSSSKSQYNAFRASRNLSARSRYVMESLYLVKKY